MDRDIARHLETSYLPEASDAFERAIELLGEPRMRDLEDPQVALQFAQAAALIEIARNLHRLADAG
jgi:hypothetical protein